jgi:hypothetical protein
MQISRCLDPGMSLIVGTVDHNNMPSCSRAVALSSSDDVATVTVYVPVATSQDTVRNVAMTRRMAVAATHVIDHCSIQLKGTTGDVRLAREDEAAFVRRQFEAFADSLDSIGIPKRVVLNAACWPAFAIDMRVEQVFEQTPGPRAGNRVR